MFTANIDTPFDRGMVVLQLCRWKFYFLSHPLVDLGVTYGLHLQLVGKRMADFLFTIIELFR